MFLIQIKGSNIGAIFNLNKNSVSVIGREKECDIRILDIMISRRHCQIEERDNKFYLNDLKSTNKTVLNGKVVEQQIELKTDDIIEIGDTALLFTNQKEMNIQSVEDYEILRKSRTRTLGQSEGGTSTNNFEL